ncbi:MAG: methyltransferase family protein [Actinomycetota bacterium]
MTHIPALGPRGEGWVIIQLALILAVATAGAVALPTAIAAWPDNVPFLIQGVLLFVIGGWLVWSGVNRLGQSRTAMPRPRDDATLIRDGIYARIRHPIYAGIVSLGIGWAIGTLSLPALIGALILAVVLDLKARREEVWLAERYPEYPAYQAGTHRFIPGVY